MHEEGLEGDHKVVLHAAHRHSVQALSYASGMITAHEGKSDWHSYHASGKEHDSVWLNLRMGRVVSCIWE